MRNHQQTDSAKIHYEGGKWIAWTPDGGRIMGLGNTPNAARRQAERYGSVDITLEWVQPANERYFDNSR